MTDPTSRIRGTAAVPTPGKEALRRALGEDGYQLLRRQRQQRGTAQGELADAVWNTAREADRLHGQLRRHATLVRHRLDDALNPHLDPAFVPATGLLQNAAHATDLYAARFAQQMNHLTLLLESYQAAIRRAGA